jgi:hypothetical protein
MLLALAKNIPVKECILEHILPYKKPLHFQKSLFKSIAVELSMKRALPLLTKTSRNDSVYFGNKKKKDTLRKTT